MFRILLLFQTSLLGPQHLQRAWEIPMLHELKAVTIAVVMYFLSYAMDNPWLQAL